ncbi:uncharacterized protein GIQ15_05711 [Arthroderma uncinatum]|uniref:uncharacterized protein n=1 Tax=Arthroderma uncinatum TaxID=74035 RepID=UPI00144A7C39|nr:uncharacterized protein GIQ15_05711 [Arthroderma uncinatum]KAF3480364.1 hypothetical protein GIQ15_05711 [Arthroderma uncinatum]
MLGVPIPPPGPKFAFLAAELLDNIFANLGPDDISNVRLACKPFANACVKYTSKMCVVSCTNDGLEKLEHLSNHPLFSQHIQSLALDCSVFWTLSPGKPNQRWDYVAEPDPRPFPWCEPYKALWQQQRDIRDGKKDAEIISKAIPRLQHLKNIHIYMDSFRRCGRLIRETYDSAFELFSFAHDKPVSCSVNQYLMVMRPLRDAGIKIESLELRDVSYSIFYPQDEIVDGMEKNFQHLTSLYIRVQAHPDKPMSEMRPTPELGEVLSMGVMARYLEAAAGLRSLTLASKDDHGNRIMAVDYAFSPNFTWEHLHTLELDNVWIREEVLNGLAARHSNTLRSLTLHNIVIRGSWFTSLPTIRDVTSLEKATVYGWLSNPAGEYPRREYWRLGVYPDREHDTPWGDDEKQHKLGLQVGSYLCKVPTVPRLPLAYSNMTR